MQTDCENGRYLPPLVVVGTLFFAALTVGAARQGTTKPHPMAVNLDPTAQEYAQVLSGPPSTHTMRSGYVVLGPGRSVGKHSTESYEEVVVILDGKGKMTITRGPELALHQRSVAYCPPHTEHDVTNVGSEPLRYLYVIAAVPAGGKD